MLYGIGIHDTSGETGVDNALVFSNAATSFSKAVLISSSVFSLLMVSFGNLLLVSFLVSAYFSSLKEKSAAKPAPARTKPAVHDQNAPLCARAEAKEKR